MKREHAVATSESRAGNSGERANGDRAPGGATSGDTPATRVKNPIQPGAPGTSLEETVESSVEKWVKEYGPPAAIAVLLVILVAAGWAFYVGRQQETASGHWDSINIGVHSKSVPTLQATAESARNSLVGVVATQHAGMVELNTALGKMLRDPQKAKEEIKAAMERFRQVLDSDRANEMLQRQAKYNLAYSHEALGEFKAALPLYKELAELKDNPFERLAKDGVQRCLDPRMEEFYTTYAAWKPSDGGTAPGDSLDAILNRGNLPMTLDPNQQLNLDDPPPIVPPGDGGAPPTPPTDTKGQSEAGQSEAGQAEAGSTGQSTEGNSEGNSSGGGLIP
jgi:predicted negative regulator of RcsB-dependent stress response